MKAVIGAVVIGMASLLVQAARKRHDAVEIEADELPARLLTPAEREFDAMVHEVADGMRSVKSVLTYGFNVTAEFWSGSRKQTWHADYVFDSETGNYKWSCPYPSAGEPRRFGDEVRRRIRGEGSEYW
ncbi:hypothetical protein ACFVVU_36010 [Kitasatospora sp. NPDC057965]|uniref:hypothetical protein n=1 Tax=Kitasatospora sp. NPDC057965 TaxID=3346291 RepID=UPI0036DC5C94